MEPHWRGAGLAAIAIGLLAACLTGDSRAAARTTSISLLIPGLHFAEEVKDTAAVGWYGLALTDSGPALVRTAVRFHSAPYRGELEGIEISTDFEPEPVLLIRGLAHPREGKVQTWFMGVARLSPRGSLTLAPGDRFQIYSSDRIPFKGGDEHTVAFTTDLTLRDRVTGAQQRIWKSLADTPVAIKWVGDLDRDGKTDLLLFDDSSESGEARWVLLLSTHARPGQLVGEAASFHRPGC